MRRPGRHDVKDSKRTAEDRRSARRTGAAADDATRRCHTGTMASPGVNPPRRHTSRHEYGRRDRLWSAALVVWLVAIVAGGGGLWRYKLTPAVVAADSPDRWPVASWLPLAEDRATLVMSVHPRCPCTRASVAELRRLVTDTNDRVRAHILVVRPPGAPDRFERTDLWDSLAAIPGVTVHSDVDGEEARRFGAIASGHVVVFDPAGRVRFSGGITGARGHEGDNPGRSGASAAILRSLDAGTGPTFGCDLVGAAAP